MSAQRTLEQDRAAAAWANVTAVRKEGYRKEYGQMAKSAPADIQANGLGQTLAFLRAKGSKDGEPKDDGNSAAWKLQEHISDWVMTRMGQEDKKGLLGWITADGTSTNDYRRATAEAIAFLIWLKRFAEAELGGE